MTAEGQRVNALRQEIIDAEPSGDREVRVWLLAKLDAFESAVRKAEDMTIAAALRDAETNPEYALHQKATLSQVADQIVGMRR